MLKASWKAYDLNPIFPLGTSRGKISKRRVWFLKLWHIESPHIVGIGEAAPLPGLGTDEPAVVENALNRFAKNPVEDAQDFAAVSSVRFAIEMAQQDLATGGKRLLFQSQFTTSASQPIPINGLVWMGNSDEMLERLTQKIDAGYRCMKMKIGAIDRAEEFGLLRIMRDTFPKEILEIRVDANGAFTAAECPAILEQLAELDIHSIEQPIKAGQHDAMKAICRESPIPIALDEELIGVVKKQELLDTIKPQFIILKPSLLGGFAAATEWVECADEHDIGWWVTSALESNIGLNAIAQWTATLNNPLPQGLGTGAMFTNNFASPLLAEAGKLCFRPSNKWDLSTLP